MQHKNFCVIGNPVAHSLSPLIHNTLYKIYGLPYKYFYREVTPDTLPQFIDRLQAEQICGFNITMPLKQDIFPHLAEQHSQTSINTVCVQQNGLCGYSTDEIGFHAALREHGGDFSDAAVVFIGAGAVTSSLAPYARRHGASRITVLNRTAAKAQKIAGTCAGEFGVFDCKKTYTAIREADILINTTPLGMISCPQFESFDFLANLSKKTLVCDLIYKPDPTVFLTKARQNGNATMSGIHMLIWQAFYAFEKFCGILPTQADKEQIMNLLV